MKIITQEQINEIINLVYQLNAPVKQYESLVKMLNNLDEGTRKEDKKTGSKAGSTD